MSYYIQLLQYDNLKSDKKISLLCKSVFFSPNKSQQATGHLVNIVYIFTLAPPTQKCHCFKIAVYVLIGCYYAVPIYIYVFSVNRQIAGGRKLTV